MEPEDNVIEDLILNGGLEIAGVDIDSGEMLYNFTPKLENLNPELYKEMSNYFHQELMSLWQLGFINISLEEESPKVSLTDKILDKIEVEKLDKNKRYSLRELIRILTR